MQITIGQDTSIESGDNSVTINAKNGTVWIDGPFEGWMGYQTLADFDSTEEGDALAVRIAANPVAELAALGYETTGWFKAD